MDIQFIGKLDYYAQARDWLKKHGFKMEIKSGGITMLYH